MEASVHDARTEATAPPPVPVDPARFPHLARVGPHLRRDLAKHHFEFGLERLFADCARIAKGKS